MKKELIRNNDLLTFRNGETVIFGENAHRQVITKFYNDNLEHIDDHNLDIISVKRPYYEDIFKTPEDVHFMDRTQLESELIERRLQVENLIHEIQRKNEYLRIYSEGLNEVMKKGKKLK